MAASDRRHRAVTNTRPRRDVASGEAEACRVDDRLLVLDGCIAQLPRRALEKLANFEIGQKPE